MELVGHENHRKTKTTLLGDIFSGIDAGTCGVHIAVALVSTEHRHQPIPSFIQALNFGRPPSFSLSTIDCKMPADATQFAFSNDDLDPPFHSIKYRYFSIYLSPVIDAILGAKSANYSTVLALDRKVRDQDLAPLIEFDTSRAPGDPIVDLSGTSLGMTMQKFMIVAWPHLSTLHSLFFLFTQFTKSSNQLCCIYTEVTSCVH